MSWMCRCEYGRDHDGSEFGLCDYCEEQAWLQANGMTDEDLQSMFNNLFPSLTQER